MYILRIEHTTRDGFSWFENLKTFRRKQDAEKYRQLYYKNSAALVQIIRVKG